MTSTPSRTTPTPSLVFPQSPKPALLAAYWLGIQALWGALLGISLQARSIELHPAHALIAYGQLATIGAIIASVVQLLAGVYSDRLRARACDRRWFFIVGAALGSIGIVAFYLAPTFNALIVALVVLQIGMNVAVGPYQAIIPDYLPPSVAGLASSWMAGFQSLGNAAGAVAAAVAAQLLLPRISIAITLVIMLAATCAVTVAHIAKLSPRPAQKIEYTVGRAALDLFFSRALLWIGFYTMLGYMLFYIQDTLHIARAQSTTGIVIIIFTVAGTLGAVLSAKPTDTLDRRAVINVSTALFMLSLVVFIVVRNVPVMFGAAALAGIGWGGFLSADWALGCSILPRGLMATAMGIWNIAVAGPQIAAPVLATAMLLWLHPDGGSAPPVAFGLAVAEVALGTLWVWRIPTEA